MRLFAEFDALAAGSACKDQTTGDGYMVPSAALCRNLA